MKKEINSKSKRKWITGGLAAFASVALLTTGFALYVVGTTQTEASGNVEVTVDTAQNQSIVFDLKLVNASIALKEANVQNGKIVSVTGNDTAEDPLKITISSATITYGISYNFNFNSIQFSIADPSDSKFIKEEGKDYASVKTASDANKLTDNGENKYARTGSDYTYIDAPEPISLTGLNPVKNGNTNTITIPEASLNLTFKWGTFFDNKSPATYYNEKYKNESDNTFLATAADQITSELTAMHDQLDTKTIKLVAKLA